MSTYSIVRQEKPTMYFVGVTTGKSSINAIFPLWMKVLGRPDVVLKGWDFKIHDDPEAYRGAVAQMKEDPHSLGALVTTHKIDLYNAAGDMFDYLDPYAELTGEMSSISKREGRLEGHAKDPITVGKALDHIVTPGYFGTHGAHVLCLGAGGSAVALLLSLINEPEAADRPARFIAVDRSQERLDHMREMVQAAGTDIDVRYALSGGAADNDALLAGLPAYSLVVNATGMGKDTPGSPITDEAVFPRHGIAWEFNYRGERDFMHQALAQIETRDLTVVDGWVYFLYGWSEVIAQVLDIDLTPELFARLDKTASPFR